MLVVLILAVAGWHYRHELQAKLLNLWQDV